MEQFPDCIQRPASREGATLIYEKEAQKKGLRRESESKLMRTAYQDGYGDYVDRLAEKWSIQAVFSEWKKQKNNLVDGHMADLKQLRACLHRQNSDLQE